jgi:hypothetical protein
MYVLSFLTRIFEHFQMLLKTSAQVDQLYSAQAELEEKHTQSQQTVSNLENVT